jgi:predicted 3-demethylubiquinone-9 3-methyltransferase (glyoxalase superfamily)
MDLSLGGTMKRIRSRTGYSPAMLTTQKQLPSYYSESYGYSKSRFKNKEKNKMQKITPFLWFNDKAEEAMNFYISIFKNSKIVGVSRYGEGGPGPTGSVMTATFELNGQVFTALNGGPQFAFTEAISFYVDCETQQEVDELWEKLSEGGEKGQCGWLKDKYGLSWQIVPSILGELLQDKDPKKSNNVMQAMLQMHKIDINMLKQAYAKK